MEPGKAQKKQSKGQSRNIYPVIDLEKAIAHASELYNKAKRHSVPVNKAYKAWGYSNRSTYAHNTLSALLQFKLLVGAGRGKDRKVKLTADALDIITNKFLDSSERKRRVLSLALNPRIYVDLWIRYKGQIPPDRVLLKYFMQEAKFNENRAKALFRRFKKIIEFSGVHSNNSAAESVKPTSLPQSIENPLWYLEEHILDESGAATVLRFKSTPSKRTYQFLRDYFDFRLKIMDQ